MDGTGRGSASEKCWRVCTRAGLATGLALAVAAAQDGALAPAKAEHFPTVDRRAQVAPSAEFDHLRALARPTGRVRVIVGLRVAFTPEGGLLPAAQEAQHRALASASAAIRHALMGTDYRVTHTFEFVPLIGLELSEEALTRLQNAGLAATLWKDTPRPPPRIAEAAMAAKAFGRGGAGVAVAILDTGVDRARLRTAKVVGEACFSANGNCPNGTTQQVGVGAGRPCTYAPSECQHGTHLVGSATGRAGTGAKFARVAPAADIIAIQVFSRFTGGQCKYEAEDPCALSFESDHIAGLQHVFRLRDTVTIGAASLSLGSGLFSLACNGNPLKLAIDNLRSVGIPTLIALGNGRLRDAAEAPPCISSAMSVPARDESDVAAATNLKPAGTTALPDLVVTAGMLDQVFPRATNWAVRDRTKFHWGHTTKNAKALNQVTSTAPASETGVKFATAQTSVVLAKLKVPELGAGEQNSDTGTFFEDFAIFDYGTYKTQICADAGIPHTVKERNETNNCKNMGPFYVIPTHLNGSVAGTRKFPQGFTLSWEGAMEFDLKVVSSPVTIPLFVYSLGPDTLMTFTVSGTVVISGKVCRWSGTAMYRPAKSDNDKILLKFGSGPYYRFQNKIQNGFKMTYILTCPGISSIKAPLDLSGMIWMDSGVNQPFPDPGLTSLFGRFVDFTAAGTADYTWNLLALDEWISLQTTRGLHSSLGESR